MLNNTWKIPVGDWSDDGHGKCDYYTVKSNFTVEQAREAYFKAVEESGIDLCKTFAHEYEDSTIEPKAIEALRDFIKHLNAEDLISQCDWEEEEDSYHVNSSEDMAYIVLYFIQRYNPEFRFEVVEDSIPMLPFYGFDDKNRHIGFFGYGLFD